MVTHSTPASPNDDTLNYVHFGAIPIRNVWLLMLYASDLYRMRDIRNRDIEALPDDIFDLVGEILAGAVERRQKKQLSVGYQLREANLGRVRGRIDVLKTERQQLLARGLVACRFQELTVDTPRNRFVRSALERASRIGTDGKVVKRCRRLARNLRFMGVSGNAPTLLELSKDRFGHHDSGDREMVAAAKLIFEMAMPTEAAGSRMMPLSERNKYWIRRLFERAVGGFFKTVLEASEWDVRPGVPLEWPSSAKTPGIRRIMPGMRTDIILDEKAKCRRIVIDTKFSAIVTAGWYRDESLKSGYLYQIYAYLRSQEGSSDGFSDEAEGVLLHPAIDATIDEAVMIQGHKIRFMTVDLTAETSAIRAELLRIPFEPSCLAERME